MTKIYHVPAPSMTNTADVILMPEADFIKYREHLAGLTPVTPVASVKKRKMAKRRTQEQILCDIAHLVPHAMPCAYGPIGRAEMRRLALEKYPNSPLADKVARRPEMLRF